MIVTFRMVLSYHEVQPYNLDANMYICYLFVVLLQKEILCNQWRTMN